MHVLWILGEVFRQPFDRTGKVAGQVVRSSGKSVWYSAMKFDRQIVAIALVSGASVLYSDDDGVVKFAAACGLAVKRVTDLPVPASQQAFPFPDGGAPVTAAGTLQTEPPPGTGESPKPDIEDDPLV